MRSTEQCKLAAIMFTDTVGCSAPAQRKALPLESPEENRQFLRPMFPRSNGTAIKTIDGLIQSQ